ncbi:unnamed protein product [Acanthoscelides obtectus]|uniref:ascorbate ferrireductase (transmembrane) n=1 Tax=Acanthoscelides obtectus TaxID=200917 RepID=A0A9P0M4Q6_ACAOB|nr:unnamed protein product [Acanthoscelides obtectus]CAK1670380.1 Cytochrome b561 domain-containing protein 1 [Acanthoscelides obtectus]
MTSEVQGKLKKQKKRRPPPHEPTIKDDLTVIAHITVVTFVILIVYLCLTRPFEFFTWHPLLMSLGWMLLMYEGIIVISKENPIGHYFGLTHDLKNFWHWVLITAASFLVLAGFAVVYTNKNQEGKDHFTSWHGLFGLLSIIICFPSVVNGTATLWEPKLKNVLDPYVTKLIHQCFGTVAIIFGGLCSILSVYSNWFAVASHRNKYMYLVGIVCTVYSFIWILQRPLLKCYRKIFKKQ